MVFRFASIIKTFISTACHTSVLGGVLLLTSLAAQAQQPTSGRVLGVEVNGDRCNLTFSNEAEQEIYTVTVDAATCEQDLGGQEVRFTYEVSQVEVIPPPTAGTVTRLSSGDRACYLDLVDADGKKTTQFASFEICRQELIGKTVRLTYEAGNILAFSCQGDMDCGKSDRVLLVTQAEVTGTAPAQPSISSLSDGNYRYWNAGAANSIISNQDLQSNRNALTFTFRKQGDNITGVFAQGFNREICVQGKVNNNTVTGISVHRVSGARPISLGESFENFFSLSDRLKVRRGRQIAINDAPRIVDGRPSPIDVVRYDSTILNLEGLSRINAGSRLPPRRC